ncbi:hypothetical protein HPB50_013471 [Hyalomma asiaticum]|uniref:Uncharacterized protein n=1 Tax=Hyalomma asiaticum TaxID=266040 RepID=A0ACB7T2F9_HYAAI|nr:hypothetical protein HPB50_013471 [Hyalomma asiaticum]
MGARIAYRGYTTAEFGLRKLSVDLSPAVKQFFVGICVKLYLDANSKLLNSVGPFRCLLPIVNIGSLSEALHFKHGSGYPSVLCKRKPVACRFTYCQGLPMKGVFIKSHSPSSQRILA